MADGTTTPAQQQYPLNASLDQDLSMAFNAGFSGLAVQIQIHRDLQKVIALLTPAAPASAGPQTTAQNAAQTAPPAVPTATPVAAD